MNSHKSAALVADDDEFFRLALRAILIEQLNVSEVIETESLDEAIESMDSHGGVAFAFFDLNMPGLDTFTGIRATREAFPNVRVAVVSASCDRYDVLRALDAGAQGFVPKGGGVKQLELAIKMIGAGEIYIPAFLTDIRNARSEAVDTYCERSAEAVIELQNITPRQQDVLNHLVKGMSNKQIARALIISESAVKFHIASLCGRLGVKNRTEVAVMASRLQPAPTGVVAIGRAVVRPSPLPASGLPRASPEAVIASLNLGNPPAAARRTMRDLKH